MKNRTFLRLVTAATVFTSVITANLAPLQGATHSTPDAAFAATLGDAIASHDFESSVSGWEGRGAATAAQSSEDAFTGTGALYVSGRTDSWNGCQLPLDGLCTAGTSYGFSVAVAPTGTKYVEMMLSLQYTENDETVYAHIASAQVLGGKWGVLSNGSFEIPATATDPLLYLETAKGSASFFVDDVLIGEPGCVETSPAASTIVGDLDGNDTINGLDLSMLKTCLLNQKLSQPATADVDGNRTFDAADATMLFDYLMGKVTEFPAPVAPPEEEDDFEYNPNLQFHEMPGSYRSGCAQSGQIIKETYTSSNDGKSTCANVYIPYGYDANDSTKKYNIFYLMHGGGENENTIFGPDGDLGKILDNMIMNGELEPMIVVTPTFNHGGVEIFYKELLNDLIPLVEGKYHTYAESTSLDDIKASRFHRAFGGFSMGSVTTWHCFLNLLDYIAYYMPLSGDCWVGNSAEEKAQACVDAVKRSGYAPDEYFVFCATGKEDIAYPNISPQVDAMKKHTDQFIYTSDLSQGNFYFLVWDRGIHWWGNVIHYIYDVLPYFFHES